jgi:hypothetical protein
MNKVIVLIEKYKNDLPNEYHYIINDLKTMMEQQKKKNSEYKKNYYHNNKDKLRSYHKKYETEKYAKNKKIKSTEGPCGFNKSQSDLLKCVAFPINEIVNLNNNNNCIDTQTLTETITQ